MKPRFQMFLRGTTYYYEDTVTRKQLSLRTRDRATALRLLNARNEAEQSPAINLQIARAYLTATDPKIAARTWQEVMDAMSESRRGGDAGAVASCHQGSGVRFHPPDARH